jgi:hypothetical protein
VIDAPVYAGRYDRMFPSLPALATEDEFLRMLGRRGGACDGGLAADSAESDDAREAAGWPFFGQFIAHDITADRSPVTHQPDAELIRNYRTPRVNLECVYGGGPVGSPYLFDRDDPAKMLLGVNDAGRPDDVPRNQQGIALVGDPRNDVHLFVTQLHVAMLKIHNLLVDRLREDDLPEEELFEEARRAATWHYQWIVLNDFLPRLIGAPLTDELVDQGSRYFGREGEDGEPFIPFEFADAAYRYGHSQIRHRYLVGGEQVPIFPDLVGFQPVPAGRVVDWADLVDVPGEPRAQRAKKIDGRLPRSLIELPAQITGDVDTDLHSLAVRDLQRGSGVGLPSGEAVASELGFPALSPAELALPDEWVGETPLWYYLLKESQVRAGGDELGPVGGRIVGEVLVGIVKRDPESFLSVEADWRPTLPGRHENGFGLADLLSLVTTAA